MCIPPNVVMWFPAVVKNNVHDNTVFSRWRDVFKKIPLKASSQEGRLEYVLAHNYLGVAFSFHHNWTTYTELL